MNSSEPINYLLIGLWRHISQYRRRQIKFLLVLMLIVSVAEILSIGAVLPFLGLLTAPERIFQSSFVQPIIWIFDLTEPKQLLLPLTIIFGLAIVIAAVLRLLLLWVNTKLSFAIGAELSMNIYRHSLYQPYAVHCARNSSELIDGISGKANGVIYNIILPTLSLISSGLILVAILVTLFVVQPLVALIVFGGLGFLYATIIFLTRKELMINGTRIARESTVVIKSLQEGLGGIRDVLIDGTQEIYCQIYRNADSALRRAQGKNIFIAGSPRYGLEALGILVITALAYYLVQQRGGISDAIPVLGLLALGAQRLLPVLQQTYWSWAQIKSGQATLQDALELLNQPLLEYMKSSTTALSFNQSIVLRGVGFVYNGQNSRALSRIDLNITKGSRVGFIGATGSGKSTLIDIIMALIPPTEGTLQVDGQIITLSNHRAWQAHIAHVPQAIFLADSSIAENIAFGIPRDQIDLSRVKQAAEQAQISGAIESWKNGYQTQVGERGIRLSGGQRQRIGIARALYKKAQVIVFDEATSALDNETEQAVMQAIESLSKDLTLLIIAHRITTLKSCNQIVELSDGSIKRVGGYLDIFNQSQVTLHGTKKGT